MSLMKDPLLEKMMMDSKQFINNPAFNDVLMHKIIKQEEKKFILRKALYYAIPVVCIIGLMLVFAQPIATEISAFTAQLSPDNILQFFKGIADYLRIGALLLLVAIVPKLRPARATV